MAAKKEPFTITGTVRDKATSRPLPGLTVKAFDVDLLSEDDFLGEDKTRADGRFTIGFEDSDFVKNGFEAFFEGGPDIVLRVYAPNGYFVRQVPKRSGAGRFEEYDISLEASPALLQQQQPERLDGRNGIAALVREEAAVNALKQAGIWTVNDLRSMDLDKTAELPVVRASITRELLAELRAVSFISAAAPSLGVAEALVKSGIWSLAQLAGLSMDEILEMVEKAIAAGTVAAGQKPSQEDLSISIQTAGTITIWFARDRVYDAVMRGDKSCEICDEGYCGSHPSVLSKAAYLAYLVRKTGADVDQLATRLRQDFEAPDCTPISVVRAGIGVLEAAFVAGDLARANSPQPLRLMLAYRVLVRMGLLRHRSRLGTAALDDFDKQGFGKDPLNGRLLNNRRQLMEAMKALDLHNAKLAEFFAREAQLGRDIIESAWLHASRSAFDAAAGVLAHYWQPVLNELSGEASEPVVEIAKALRSRLIELSGSDASKLRKRYHVNFLAEEGSITPCDQAIVTLQEDMRCNKAWYIACCEPAGEASPKPRDVVTTRFKDYPQYRLWVEQALFPENFYDQHVQAPLIRGDVAALREQLNSAKEVLREVTARPFVERNEQSPDVQPGSLMGLFDEGFEVIGNLLDVDHLMVEGHQAVRDEEYGIALARYREAQERIRRHAKQHHSATLATYEQIFQGTPASCAGASELVTNAVALKAKLNVGQVTLPVTRSLISNRAPDDMNVGWFPRFDAFPTEQLKQTWQAIVDFAWHPDQELGLDGTLLDFVVLSEHSETRDGVEGAGWKIYDYEDGERRTFPLLLRKNPDFQGAVAKIENATKELLIDLFGDKVLSALNDFVAREYEREIAAISCLKRNVRDSNVLDVVGCIVTYIGEMRDDVLDAVLSIFRAGGEVVDNLCSEFEIYVPHLPNSLQDLADIPEELVDAANDKMEELARSIGEVTNAIASGTEAANTFCSEVVSALANTILVDDESVWGSRDGAIEELSNLHNVEDVRDKKLLRRGTLLVDLQSVIDVADAAGSYEAVFKLQTTDNDDIGIVFHATGVDGHGLPSYYLLSLRNDVGEDDWRPWVRAGFLVGYPIAVLGLAHAVTLGSGYLGLSGGIGTIFLVPAGLTVSANILVAGALAFPAALSAAKFAEESLFPTDRAGAFVRLIKVHGNVATNLSTDWANAGRSYKPKPNRPYGIKLKVETRDAIPEIWVDVYEGEVEESEPVVRFHGKDKQSPLTAGGVGLYAFANSPSKFLRADLTTQRSVTPDQQEASLGELLFLPAMPSEMDWSPYERRKKSESGRLHEWVSASADDYRPVWFRTPVRDVEQPENDREPPGSLVALSLFGLPDEKLDYVGSGRQVDRQALAELTNRLVGVIPHQYFFLLPLCIGDALHAMGDYEGAKRHYDVCYDVFPNEVERRGGAKTRYADPEPGRRYSYLHADNAREFRIGVEERLLRGRHAANELARGEAAFLVGDASERQRAYEHFTRVLRVYRRAHCCEYWPGTVRCTPGADMGSLGTDLAPGGGAPEAIPPDLRRCEAAYRRLLQLLRTMSSKQRDRWGEKARDQGIDLQHLERCKDVDAALALADRILGKDRARTLGTPEGCRSLRARESRRAGTIANFERARRAAGRAAQRSKPTPLLAAAPISSEPASVARLTMATIGTLILPDAQVQTRPDVNAAARVADPCGTLAEHQLLDDLLDPSTFGGCAPGNPRVRALVGKACMYLRGLDLGLNMLWLRPDATQYRYAYLLSLARHYAGCAVTAEKDFIQFREKLASARLTTMQWEHTLRTLGIQARMQQIAIRQAENQLLAAEYQVAMVDRRDTHNEELRGLNQVAMVLTVADSAVGVASGGVTGVLSTAAAVATAVASGGTAAPVAAALAGSAGTGASTSGGLLRSGLEILSVYQQGVLLEQQRELLMDFEKPMANLARRNAELALDVANLQAALGQMEISYAQSVCSYIANQFLNAEMYSFLAQQMKGNYRHYLGLATYAARMAEQALELERGRDYSVVKASYFDVSVQGLLGGEALAADLEALEFQRISRDEKRQFPQPNVFSLRSAFPLQFQAFRTTGALPFRAEETDFDRDVPGHYYRQIRSVRVVVYALAGFEAIKATLTHLGPSEIVVSETDGFRKRVLPGVAERMALAGSPDRVGLAVLNPVGDERLNPFEGRGVAGSWLLEMPRHANAIDFDSIADVMFVVEYSCFNDEGYRKEVSDRLRKTVWRSSRVVSVRQDLPDAFYHLTNPSPSGPAITTSAALNRCTFEVPLNRRAYPPNQANLRLDGIIVAFIDNAGASLPLVNVTVKLAARKHVELLWKQGRLETKKPAIAANSPDHTWVERGGDLIAVPKTEVRSGEVADSGPWIRVLRNDRVVWIPESRWGPQAAGERLDGPGIKFSDRKLPRVVPGDLLRLAQCKIHIHSIPAAPKYGKLTEYFELRVRDDGTPPKAGMQRVLQDKEIVWVEAVPAGLAPVEPGEWLRDFDPSAGEVVNPGPPFAWVPLSRKPKGTYAAEDVFYVSLTAGLDENDREKAAEVTALGEVVVLANYQYELPL